MSLWERIRSWFNGPEEDEDNDWPSGDALIEPKAEAVEEAKKEEHENNRKSPPQTAL